MKFFIDTANIAQIREVNDLGLLDGVTTNPSLIAKEKKAFRPTIEEICSIVKGPVSAEVVALDTDGMLKEGREVASWAKNVVVKIPMTPAGMKATKILASEGISVNVTLVFSLPQALIAAKAGAKYISPFIGRLDDIGQDGMELVEDSVEMCREFEFDCEIIAASIRGLPHVIDSIRCGAHIATIPYATLMALFKHPLTDKGIDAFMKDWNNAGLGKIL
jgi:transaldolase